MNARTTYFVLTALLLGGAGVSCAGRHRAPPAAVETQRLEDWSALHPEAARDLCEWVAEHPDDARLFFDWHARHPSRALEFVSWAVSHREQSIEAFLGTHPAWSDFDFGAEAHRPAASSFLEWARRHPDAAQDLISRPGALDFSAKRLGC